MPTYDYKCNNCGHAFELFQSMKDDPIRVCPSCGEEAVKRLIGAGAGLVFKGSGFYLTDYVKNGNGKAASAASSANKESESASSGSSQDTSGGDAANGTSTPATGGDAKGSSKDSTSSSAAGTSPTK